MDVAVRKEGGHFFEEEVEKTICIFIRRVEDGVEDSPFALDLERTRSRGQSRIGNEPTCRMARDVELGHDPDAAIRSVGDDVPDLVLGIIKSIRTEPMQAGKDLALKAKALVIGQVPVEDVQFDSGHPVQVSLDDIHGHEVAGGINEEPPPGESGLIIDLKAGNEIALAVGVHELKDGLKAMEDAEVGLGNEKDAVRIYSEAVGLVFERFEPSGRFIFKQER